MEKDILFPRIIDHQKLFGVFGGYKGNAAFFVREFERMVFPVLKRFSIFNDESIKKYLKCESFKDIYQDISTSPIAQFYNSMIEQDDYDLWKPFREYGCEVKQPDNENFIFAPLPYATVSQAKEWISAIKVHDCKLEIDKNILRELCVVKPTERQIAAYKLAVQFCEGIKKIGYEKKPAEDYFSCDKEGNIIPSARGIIWNKWDMFH